MDTKRIRAFGGIFGREHDPITIDELLIFSNNDNESDDDDNDSYLCICNKIIIIEVNSNEKIIILINRNGSNILLKKKFLFNQICTQKNQHR